MKHAFGCIGVGNMGGAILQGAVSCGMFKPEQIAVYSRNVAAAEKCRENGYVLLENELAAFENSEVLMLAIKPQGMTALFEALRAAKSRPALIISIITGYSTEKIEEQLGAPVARVMPNTPLLLGCGATGISVGKTVSPQQLAQVVELFGAMGMTCVLEERLINETIPLSGSLPAFAYYFMEILARNAEKNGMIYQDALAMCAKGFEGAAKMVLKGEKDPQTLIKNVCSPGGATLKGLEVLDDGNISGLLKGTAFACIQRARELGN